MSVNIQPVKPQAGQPVVGTAGEGMKLPKKRTGPAPEPLRVFHIQDGINLGRKGNKVVLRKEAKDSHVDFEIEDSVWVSAVAHTMSRPSPEMRTILDFLMGARQDSIDKLAEHVITIRDSYAPPA